MKFFGSFIFNIFKNINCANSIFINRDDLVRAIKKLKAMGNGFGMIPVGGSYLVQSVPAELNMDHTVVLQLAEVINIEYKNNGLWFKFSFADLYGKTTIHLLQKKGYVTVSEIKDSLKWEKERACHVLVSNTFGKMRDFKHILNAWYVMRLFSGSPAERRAGMVGYSGCRRTTILATCALLWTFFSWCHPWGSESDDAMTRKKLLSYAKNWVEVKLLNKFNTVNRRNRVWHLFHTCMWNSSETNSYPIKAFIFFNDITESFFFIPGFKHISREMHQYPHYLSTHKQHVICLSCRIVVSRLYTHNGSMF